LTGRPVHRVVDLWWLLLLALRLVVHHSHSLLLLLVKSRHFEVFLNSKGSKKKKVKTYFSKCLFTKQRKRKTQAGTSENHRYL
jgi:hypothetical protein